MDAWSGLYTALVIACLGGLGTLIRWGISVEKALQAQAIANVKHIGALDALLVRIEGHEAVDDQREKRSEAVEVRLGQLEHAVAFSAAKR